MSQVHPHFRVRTCFQCTLLVLDSRALKRAQEPCWASHLKRLSCDNISCVSIINLHAGSLPARMAPKAMSQKLQRQGLRAFLRKPDRKDLAAKTHRPSSVAPSIHLLHLSRKLTSYKLWFPNLSRSKQPHTEYFLIHYSKSTDQSFVQRNKKHIFWPPTPSPAAPTEASGKAEDGHGRRAPRGPRPSGVANRVGQRTFWLILLCILICMYSD